MLAPGFLPLIVFIVADSVWGTAVGLMVAVAFGILEMAWTFVRDRSIDRFVLLDTGLIIVLGGVSLIMKNDIFFKLKPALIEIIFCLILGISAFSTMNILAMMSRRYLKQMQLEDAQVKQMRRFARTLFFVFLGHTILIVYSAFFWSRKAWAFVSGGLFYILFGVFFIVEFFRMRRNRKANLDQYADDEWFDIVDPEGRVKGKAPRTLCHSGPGLLHPVVHLHVVNIADQIFLQKRSMKKQIQPGKWDTAVGGHIQSGEQLEDALKREAFEELGLTNYEVRFIGKYIWETEVESELVFAFAARLESVPKINRDEIDEGKFWKIKKIRENLKKSVFTPNFEHEFKTLLSDYLSGSI